MKNLLFGFRYSNREGLLNYLKKGRHMEDNNGNPQGNATPEIPPPAPKKKRGFGSMDPALVREIARKGGKAAHEKGTAHEFSPEEARVAGRKGGKATHAKKLG